MIGRSGIRRDRALCAHLLGGNTALAKAELTDDEIPNRGQFVIGITRHVRMHEHRSLISLELRAVCQHLSFVIVDRPLAQLGMRGDVPCERLPERLRILLAEDSERRSGQALALDLADSLDRQLAYSYGVSGEMRPIVSNFARSPIQTAITQDPVWSPGAGVRLYASFSPADVMEM
jgi:hypothetical protein